jgi:hypothetical protein
MAQATADLACPHWLPVGVGRGDSADCACMHVESFIVLMGWVVLPLYFGFKEEQRSR